jgi:prepilin-type N-terminal cleavage/methylation domain-containing protein
MKTSPEKTNGEQASKHSLMLCISINFTGDSLMKSKGFTLIELAVVIAIIAILAAVAIPRFGNTTAQAERSMIKDMVSQLTSASSIYTAEQASTPNGFDQFVTQNQVPASPFTMSVSNFGTPAGGCTVGTDTITGCRFSKYTNVTYTFNPGGVITVSATPADGAPAL